MSFLQPMLLAALPLVALPIIIHLINQRRYQTMRWAAMMFLLAANRMSRGYARLRQWLIMAMRMAAIAGLIFAVSRPLAGGWLGLTAGGRADTTIILLDRSPSMQQVGADARGSKLETGVRQLVRTLETLGSARWVLIDSNTQQAARAGEDRRPLDDRRRIGPASASADLPAMLLAALDYVKANKAGRTEIWICSDIRENDWNAASGRWQALRDGFLELTQGVRFHLLAYPQTGPDNLSVRVTDVRRQKTGDGGGAFDLAASDARGGRATRTESGPGAVRDRRGAVRGDGRAGRARGRAQGPPRSRWRRAATAAGAGFRFRRTPTRRTTTSGSSSSSPRPGGRSSSPTTRRPPGPCNWPPRSRPIRRSQCTAEVVAAGQLAAVDWDQVSLLLWQAPAARRADGQAGPGVRRPRRFGDLLSHPCARQGELFGVRWTSWVDQKAEAARRELARRSGPAGPHGQRPAAAGRPAPDQEVLRPGGRAHAAGRRCGAARRCWRGSRPTAAAAYFCATTPAAGDSSLATERRRLLCPGPARAGQRGAAALGNTRQLTAGEHRPGRPDDLEASRRRAERPCRPTTRFTGASTRRANGCWPSTAPPAKRRRRCWPTAAWPGCSRASTSPGSTTRPAASARSSRRSGGCSWSP